MGNQTYKQINFFKKLLEQIIESRDDPFPTSDLPDRTELVGQLELQSEQFHQCLKKELLMTEDGSDRVRLLMDHYIQLRQVMTGGVSLLERGNNRHGDDFVLQALVGHVSELMDLLQDKLECPIRGSGMEPVNIEDRETIGVLLDKTGAICNNGNLHMDLMRERIREYIMGKQLRFYPGREAGSYFLKVLRSMQGWDWSEDGSQPFTASERFLFYMNYNSKAFMDDLVRGIQRRVAAQPTWDGKFVVLLEFRKKILQMHFRLDAILNPGYQGVREFMENWFQAEIFYLENAGVLVEGRKARNMEIEVSPANKLMCNLSADQLSILLRAMDEIRLVEARSLSQVYRAIVPYLSTRNRKDLSADSLRVKSYQVDFSDRKKVLDVLERLATKVNAM